MIEAEARLQHDEELAVRAVGIIGARHRQRTAQMRPVVEFGLEVGKLRPALTGRGRVARLRHEAVDHAVELDPVVKAGARELLDALDMVRSEEHTSELQSLMRNSYAVFCLRKTPTT